MTDVQQLTPTLPPTTTLGRPAPRPPRRGHRLAWWVVATIVLGALIGGGLAVLAENMAESGEVASSDASSTTTPGLALSIPPGLINGRAESRPAIHSIDNRVFVVGDSVMQGAAPHLGALLDGWSLIADTRVGRFLDEANRVIAKRRKDIGMIAVLNLGNNYNGSEEQFAAEVEESMQLLTGVPHVIWINVAEFEDDRAEVNDVLRRAALTHANLTVVDWNSWWEKDDSLTAGDRLHLSPAGSEAYAALVASAVTEVTEAAGEIPAPGAKPPKLNTSGRIPAGSGGSSGSSSRSSSGSSGSSSRSSRRTVRTTAPPVTQAPVQPSPEPPVPSPPLTSPPDTTPPASTPPGPPASTP